ncbi:replicative helicase loader/inhibitor [Velocimicrobium porci]|nr:replicative helicase loader/inhibitor [Velocimicrobium porci]
MNVTEFATIASAIKAAYPNANLMPDKRSKEIWYTMLSDLDYVVCMTAIKEHISTNRFPPSIAEIREQCANIAIGKVPDWGEGWEQVEKAIRSCGMYQEEEALKRMDETTKICVKRLGWKNICLSENIVADRANFRMIYEQIVNRSKREAQLSLGLKEEKQRLYSLIHQTEQKLLQNEKCGENDG